MNKRITNEQREAIVRNAVAKRDALLTASKGVEGLTDEEVGRLIDATADPIALGTITQRLHRFARAIEAAHGIVEPAPSSDDATGQIKKGGGA